MYKMDSFHILTTAQKLLLIITTNLFNLSCCFSIPWRLNKQNKIKSKSAYSLVLKVNIKANILIHFHIIGNIKQH